MITGEKKYTFDDFINIVRTLRQQCPWDRKQTHKSLCDSFLEEAYEVIDAITTDNFNELKKELGDLLLHIVLHSIIAEEGNHFCIDEVISTSAEKMIRRHPHVFGNKSLNTAEEVTQQWEQHKFNEGREYLFDGIPDHLPALLKAQRVQEKASKVGFDWKDKSDVWKKVEEELSELRQAEESGNQAKIEEEFGDALFALVNYSRFIGVQSEQSLQMAIKKFIKRFRKIEDALSQQGKDVFSSSFEEMDSLWNFHKDEEKLD